MKLLCRLGVEEGMKQASLSAALLLLLPAFAAAQVAAPPSISTTGEATVYVVPDEVTINVGVETYNPSLADAKKELDQRSKSLLAAAKAAGVAEKDIQTDRVQVEIEYRSNDNVREVRGYTTRRLYVFKLRDISKTESVVDGSLSSGANLLYGIEYNTAELRQHRDQARKMAAKAAKEKADLLAGELGVTAGAPRSISESYYYALPVGRANLSQNSFQNAGGEGGEGTMPPGQIAVKATVSVTFELMRGK